MYLCVYVFMHLYVYEYMYVYLLICNDVIQHANYIILSCFPIGSYVVINSSCGVINATMANLKNTLSTIVISSGQISTQYNCR